MTGRGMITTRQRWIIAAVQRLMDQWNESDRRWTVGKLRLAIQTEIPGIPLVEVVDALRLQHQVDLLKQDVAKLRALDYFLAELDFLVEIERLAQQREGGR
jgi:hypothetical protein